MGKGMNKEQVFFLVAAALAAWVLVKLFLAQGFVRPSNARVGAVDLREGEKEIGDFLGPRSLATYVERGHTHGGQPSRVFIRGAVAHSFLDTTVFSRYTFECRMFPAPVRELRFQLPSGLVPDAVFSREIDPEEKYGTDGRTLVVHVKPTLLKRCYYGCQIAVTFRAPLSAASRWRAPLVSCTDATPNVESEAGSIAIATPGDRIEVIPIADAGATSLTKITLDALPKELIQQSNKLAFEYHRPDYLLTLGLKRPDLVSRTPTYPPRTPRIGPTPRPPTIGPKTTEPTIKEPTPTEPKLQIPKAGDVESLPFKLQVICRIEEPEARRQAVLRHKETEEYFRAFEGEKILNDYRIASITDDAVVIHDSKGKVYKLRGKFEDKYKD
jgi:hypothetical protein